jgi:hypothetical protein
MSAVEILEFISIVVVSIAGFMIGWNLAELMKKNKK